MKPLLRKALAAYGKPGSEHASFFLLGNAETALGDCLRAQKRYAEAEPLLLTGYDKSKQKYGSSSPEVMRGAGCLHDLYLAWNKPTEAARYQSEATVEMDSAP